MKEKLLSIGSTLSSFLAAICWIGIALFTSLGLSGLGLAFVSTISPYKNVFILLTIVMLGLAHYFMTRNNTKSISSQILLWLATTLSLGFIIYSSFFGNTVHWLGLKMLGKEVLYAVYRWSNRSIYKVLPWIIKSYSISHYTFIDR